MANQKIQAVATVGVGTVGASWAIVFATHGLETRLYDAAAGATDRAETFMNESMSVLVQAGYLTPQEAEAAKKRVRKCGSLEEALNGVDFVQESAPESYEVKRPLFKEMDSLCAPEILLASSSSGLLISEIQAGLIHPERCLVAHPFNPPHLIPLVELVPGPQTKPETLERAREFYRSLEKTPITLRKEVPGHIVNRLAAALWREAIDLAVRGVASVEDIDKAVSDGPGLRWALMGQHLIYHLNGGPGGIAYFLEHLGPSYEAWWKDLAAWTDLPPEASAVLVEGIKDETGARTFKEIQDWRDEHLLKLVRLLGK